MSRRGPLPQWDQPGGIGTDIYETDDPDGRRWRLWFVATPTSGDPFPSGYRLAPCDDLGNVNFVSADHGLYYALDVAGLRISGDAVRADPGGARRQLGLEEGD